MKRGALTLFGLSVTLTAAAAGHGFDEASATTAHVPKAWNEGVMKFFAG